MRLDKFLADMGKGTRSELKKKIRSGKCSVNGTMVKDPGTDVQSQDQVVLEGSSVCYESFQYYMLNKPAGVISATEDRRQTTVLDLLGEEKRTDLFPVGRLDRDTEGLLLLTNDGQLAHGLLSPRRHIDKRYFVRVRGRLEEADRLAFARGLKYDENLTALPAELRILSAGEESEAEVVIQEGKFHQIKKMLLVRGKEVLYLKRLSMGRVELDPSLAPGEYRRLTEEELAALVSSGSSPEDGEETE